LVSVVIATYGDIEWLHLARDRAHPSVLIQDECEVVMHHEPDGSRATSLNNGAARTTGEWLLFLDADDEFAPGYVGAMRRALEQNPGDGNRKVLFTPAVQQIRKGRPGDPVFFDRGISLRDDNWLVIGTMIHRDLFTEVGGFPDYPHGFEDFALWSKCYRAGASVVKVPDAVYRYFHNPQSAHKKGWRDRKWQVATHQRVVAELDAWEAAR
jgi:glycosyltransferase involved in cell wall biosynthesis